MSDHLSRPSHAAFPLFRHPAPLARRTDPETSKAAARSIDTSTICGLLLNEFRKAGAAGLTSDEAGMRLSISGIWKRISDLERLGEIVDSGTTRKGLSGRQQRVMVWRQR